MSIFIKELLHNKFEIFLKIKAISKHIVLLTDEYYDSLNKKIFNKKVFEYSFQVFLDSEANMSIFFN